MNTRYEIRDYFLLNTCGRRPGARFSKQRVAATQTYTLGTILRRLLTADTLRFGPQESKPTRNKLQIRTVRSDFQLSRFSCDDFPACTTMAISTPGPPASSQDSTQSPWRRNPSPNYPPPPPPPPNWQAWSYFGNIIIQIAKYYEIPAQNNVSRQQYMERYIQYECLFWRNPLIYDEMHFYSFAFSAK